MTNLTELLYMCRLCFLSVCSVSKKWQSCRRAAFISLSAFVYCPLCSCFLVQRAGRKCFTKMLIVAFRRQQIWFLFPVSVLNKMKYLVIVSPSDLILCMCFRCCGDSQLSFKHWLCVSQWSLRRVPPGVRQQGRLCWRIRWEWLWWVQMELMRFHLIVEQKNNSPLSFSFTDAIFGLPGACTFNMDESRWEETCQLSQDTDDDFDWRLGQQSETPGAGPHADHSPGQYPLCSKHNKCSSYRARTPQNEKRHILYTDCGAVSF